MPPTSAEVGGVVFVLARYNRRVSLLTKRRTREHVIADLSVNHAERAFLLAGHTSNRVFANYGYDMIISTFDDEGRLESGLIYVQMKASDVPDYSHGGDFLTTRVDERDDALWSREDYPVALIVYDAAKDIALYVHYQNLTRTTRRSVRIPTTGRFDIAAVRQLRDAKNAAAKG